MLSATARHWPRRREEEAESGSYRQSPGHTVGRAWEGAVSWPLVSGEGRRRLVGRWSVERAAGVVFTGPFYKTKKNFPCNHIIKNKKINLFPAKQKTA